MKARVYFNVAVNIDIPKELEDHIKKNKIDSDYEDELFELASNLLDKAKIILPQDIYIDENFD